MEQHTTISPVSYPMSFYESRAKNILNRGVLWSTALCDNKGWDITYVFDEITRRILGTQGICDNATIEQVCCIGLALIEFSRYRKGTLDDRIRRAVFHSVDD